MDQIKNVLYDTFGEQNTEFNAETGETLIRIAPFEITNEKQQKHLIKGLWVRFTLILDGENIQLRYFQGARSYQTILEYKGRYRHSHLTTGTVESGFSEFCKGSGEFGAMCSMSRVNQVPLHELDKLLLLMKYFLMYEDLDNPHTRIAGVASIVAPIVRIVSSSQLDTLLKNSVILNLAFDNEYRMTDSRQNHSLLLAACPDLDKVLKINGEYGSLSSLLTSEIDHDPVTLFTFKGQPVMSEVGPADELVVSAEYYVNPHQFKHINDEFHGRIKSYILQEEYADSVQARHTYDSFIRELPAAKQILMFKNI